MTMFEEILVQFFTFIGPGVHGMSSTSSQGALLLGLI